MKHYTYMYIPAEIAQLKILHLNISDETFYTQSNNGGKKVPEFSAESLCLCLFPESKKTSLPYNNIHIFLHREGKSEVCVQV